MDKHQIMTQVEAVFKTLQELEIRASVTNTRTILGCLRTLQDIYAALDALGEEAADESLDG